MNLLDKYNLSKNSTVTRFFLIIIIITIVGMSIAALLLYYMQDNTLNTIMESEKGRLERKSDRFLNIMANIAADPMYNYDYNALQKYPEEAIKDKDISRIAFIEADGDVIAEKASREYSKKDKKLVKDIFYKDEKLGRIEINISEAEFNKDIAKIENTHSENLRRFLSALIIIVIFEVIFLFVSISYTFKKMISEKYELERYKERLEELVDNRTRELKESEKSLKDAQRIAHLGSWVFEVETGVYKGSDEAFRVFGLEPQSVVEPDVAFVVNMVHPDDREYFIRTFEDALHNNKAYNVEYRIIMPDGSEKIVNSRATVYYEDGQPKSMAGTIQDITERKKAEQALKKAHDELEKKVKERTKELEQANIRLKELDKLKSMFIASMSHELRTPLNSIIGFTGIILQGMSGEISDEQREQLKMVYGSANHLLTLITDVIDISKIEAGKIGAFVQECRLGEIIDEAVAILKTQIEEKGLSLEMNVPEGIDMNTDRGRLLQCVINYLSNAVKFTPKGKIRISAREFDGMVEIKVKDTGIGIKKEDIGKLFSSFVRLDSPLKTTTPGTGLGLYLTKKLATEVLSGEVSVESVHGEGSVFTITLPKELKTVEKV